MSGGNRRRFLAQAALGIAAAARADRLWANPEAADGKTKAALQRGVIALLKRQQADGAFPSERYHTWATGLTGCGLLLADAALGSTELKGPLAKCQKWLLEHVAPSGFVGETGSLYVHGFALLFLARRMQHDGPTELRETIRKAVDLLVRSQGPEGGWRYVPHPMLGDMSSTVCQMMALRAARDANIDVPQATIDHGLKFIRLCQDAKGGFAYLPNLPGSLSCTSSALAALAAFTDGTGEDVKRGLAFFHANFKPEKTPSWRTYQYYYAFQALQILGRKDPQQRPACQKIVDDLLASQTADGTWNEQVGVELATAFACATLGRSLAG